MQVGVLVTNGGPHSPETWAAATAEHITPLGPGMDSSRQLEAMKLRLKIAAALIPHHAKVQENERGRIRDTAGAHLMSPLNADEYLDDALAQIIEAAKGSLWEEQFAKPEVQAQLRHEIGTHFRTAQDIERSWASGKTKAQDAHRAKHSLPPRGAHADAYLAQRHPGE